MTDDRSLERAARSWLEEGPVQAPDHAVSAALARIQSTPQERDLRIPWRLPTMNPLTKAVLVAAIGVIAFGSALYVFRPGFGPGNQATPSPTAAYTPSDLPRPTPPLKAGPLEFGTYVGPTLQVADIIAQVNADSTLTPSQRTRIIDELFEVRDKTTWTDSIGFTAGRYTERQTVDGVTVIGSYGAYAFPNDQTLNLIESVGGTDVVTSFEITVVGDSFTLNRTTPGLGPDDEFVLNMIFESGPFTLVP